MSDDIQSIEDLMHSGDQQAVDEDSLEGKFEKKQREIQEHDLERMTSAKASAIGVPYINLTNFPISHEALGLIDEEEARSLEIICFFYNSQSFRLACQNPLGPAVQEKLKELEKKLMIENSEIYLTSSQSLNHAFELYKNLPKIQTPTEGVEITDANLQKFQAEISSFKSLGTKINEVNMSDVIVLLIATALKVNSSDIHIEAEEKEVIVRLRVDGVLQSAATIEKDKWHRIISRLKVLSKVKINIEDKPQEGRFTIFTAGENINVRSSFLPTVFGESVVMRLLHASSAKLSFDTLGLSANALAKLKDEIDKPNGLILVTGPTGSGKTTTLYAALNHLNIPGTKIITLEDPIEYQLENINQSQVDESKGYTFSNGLRSVLRQDPDIVMIGEMRDLETAEIGVRAALTGHLVLSTIHTNDSASAIPRMLDLGVKPYLLSPAINAIIGQRLVRKLCQNCKKIKTLDENGTEKIKKILAVISPSAKVDVPKTLPIIYEAVGCEQCSNLGYIGRIGIYEVLLMSQAIKELSTNNAPAFKILEQAIEDGMVTMLQDGILKCLAGITSLEEVYKVAGKMDYVDTLYDIAISKTIGRGIKLTEEQLAIGKEINNDLKVDHGPKLTSNHTNEILAIVMSGALAADASDVHIDPTENSVKIRYRIDGLLYDIASLSKEYYVALLGEIKTSAGFPTNLKKPTYDGRFALIFKDSKVDCRLSIIIGGYGETVAIRILASQAKNLNMKELGIGSAPYEIMIDSMKKTKGIIFTTGPTGSGKTTTLYSIINTLNSPTIKIITIEDPIEYNLEGIVQTQINTEEGYTFASALRSLLRQNPNVIMVGEIRDDETAKISVEAALTGHLVLSTIHANSAAGAIARFVGLGVDKSLLASAVACTIGQRLVRKLCPSCKKVIDPTTTDLEKVQHLLEQLKNKERFNLPEKMTFYGPVGCVKCGSLGYKGRSGIYEAIEMTAEMQKLIQTIAVTDGDIEKLAIEQGAILMVHDGILKAIAGETSLEEVFRVAL
ncbi:MAG TPA: GspE/PulE family protein [bacterium]|jgi:type IV pilus assembly protein PilB|nr:GspE/PulE family protein [bacterium]